jgi:hypothetical protein
MTMRPPSGEKAGSPSFVGAGVLLTFVSPEPSGEIV